MRWVAQLSIVSALLAACQTGEPERVEPPTSEEGGTVPIEWAGPNQAAILVPVHINGTGPHSFVLDTGATLTCVETSLADELSLPEPSGQVAVGAGIEQASPSQIRLVTIDSLRVGDAEVKEMPACAIDIAAAAQLGIDFEGLLGLNFLRQFDLRIDFENEQVILR